MLLPTMAKSETIDIDDDEEDDDDIIDKDQLDEYREWVEQLGSFPVCIIMHQNRIVLQASCYMIMQRTSHLSLVDTTLLGQSRNQ